MNDRIETKQQLVEDLGEFRQRVAESEIFRSLFRESSVGTVVVTPNGRFIQANRAFCDFLGYSEPELVGQTVLSITHPDDRESTSTAIRQAAESVARIQRLEKRYLHKSGRNLWGEVSSTLIHDAEGKPSYFITQVLDISERKQAEEALKKANNELEERVRERTAELQEANKKLRQEVEERIRTEEALRQSELGFRNYFEQGLIGMAVTSVDKRWLEVNDRLCEIIGYSREELAKTNWEALTHPDDIEPNRGLFNPLLAGEIEHFTLNKRYIKKDGKIVYTTIHTRAYRKKDGTVDHIVTLMEDITARKQAEEALRQSHDEIKAIYDRMADGLLITDIETLQFVRANASMCRMLGYSETELLSMSVRDLHPAEALPHILESILKAKETDQTPPGSIPVLRKDRSIFYAEVIGKFLTYNARPCAMGIFRDITERMQAEAALAESEAKYRQLVETTKTGYLILDDEGRVVDANEEYVRISGHHDLNEIVGHSVVEWTASYDRDRNARKVEECVRVGQIRELEIDYIGPDDTVTPVEINASVITTKEGKRILSLCRDITERRQAQEALERERQSLWKMLQASDHERQIISYEIHDGLAQYLAAAGMQFQAYESMKENLPDEAKHTYETAVALVRQAHSESRRLISEVRHPVIDESGLETAISHLVHEQRRRGGPNIECYSSVQFGRLPSIFENALYRITQEALTNACKHSKSKKVTVTLTQEGQDVRLEVRDWGIGFNPEAVGEGHFGLEGIRQRVQLLGGRLTIESRPGSGTLVQAVVSILEKQGN
jgi:PAS domain S-box-containing protein